MAERRPRRFIEPLLLRFIETSDRPPTVRVLQTLLERDGEIVARCQILRGLERLLAQRVIARVELGKVYVAANDTQCAKLICSKCRCVRMIVVANASRRLQSLIEKASF